MNSGGGRSDLQPRGAVPLLERERELASLAELIRGAAAGEARIGLIDGPAGIGKTRLLGEARRHGAEAGLRVLGARGSELEREFPYGVVRQLFEPALVDAGARQKLLDGAAGAARVVFQPVDEASRVSAAGDASFAVLHGLFWLTVNLSAEGPLLLAVDDLHWCDHPSLRFLAYAARRLEGLPVVVVCSLRPAEPGVDTALLGEIVSDPLTVSVHPRPLSDAAVAELVEDRLGAGADHAFSAACHSATGGNPLLLGELLKALDTEGVRPDAEHVQLVNELGPRAASRAVLLRLGRLSPQAAAVAHGLAILGEGADVSTLAALAGLAEEEVAQATGALVRAEILQPEPPLGFVHPLVAAAVYHDIPPGERELRHGRAARLLTETGAPAERVAAHLVATPGRADAGAVETLRGAARAASQQGAAESAVAFLRRALDEPPSGELRPEVLLELGLAEALTHGPAAAQHLSEAYESISDPVVRGSVARVLGLTLLQTGSFEEAATVASRAAAELPTELDSLRLQLKAFEAATLLFGVPRPEGLLWLEDHRVPREGASTGEKLCMGMAANFWTYTDGTADACARLALAALAGGDAIEADNGFLALAPTLALVSADRDEALDAWEASLAEAHRSGSLYSISSIHLWHGFALYRRGELVEAEQELANVFDEFEDWGFALLASTYCSAFLGVTLLERGDLEGARKALARGSDTGRVADGIRWWLTGRLELLVAEGRAEEALEVARELRSRFLHMSNPAIGPWRSLEAQALDRLARTDEALAVAREELELAQRWGAPWALGRALRVLGTLEREEGLERLEEAVEVLAGSPARLEYAKALAALGTALRHLRRPSDAREPLRRAFEVATVCGADGLAEQVRAELNAAGIRPRTTALQGVGALTASESRVAALAADGQSNRDIAQALFVTPKTVEVHLSSAYRKLGIRSRRELARALAGA